MTRMSTAVTPATIQVLATTPDGTRAALTSAVPMSRGTQARLIVVVPQVIPYPLALERPVTSCAFVFERYRSLLEEVGAEATIQICLCRRLADALACGLSPDATIVIGGTAGRWFPSREQRMAGDLMRAGRRVVFVTAPGRQRHEPRSAPHVVAIVAAGRH